MLDPVVGVEEKGTRGAQVRLSRKGVEQRRQPSGGEQSVIVQKEKIIGIGCTGSFVAGRTEVSVVTQRDMPEP